MGDRSIKVMGGIVKRKQQNRKYRKAQRTCIRQTAIERPRTTSRMQSPIGRTLKPCRKPRRKPYSQSERWLTSKALQVATTFSLRPAFSYFSVMIATLGLLLLGLQTASWLVILFFKARSNLAPRASLLRFSVFSWVGVKRCCCICLLSKRPSPSVISLISVTRGSLANTELELIVPSETCESARDGESLKVEKRAEARLF
jgi:hypothetical protein